GRCLAVAEFGQDESTVLWNLESELATALDLDSAQGNRPVFSTDGRWLLVGGGSSVQVYDLETHTLATSLPTFGFVVGRPAGGLAIADNRWIELPQGRSIQSAPADRLRGVQATRDSRFVITLTTTQTRVWSAEDHLALERWAPPPGQVIRHFGAEHVLTADKAGVWRIHARRDRARAPLVVGTKLEKVVGRVTGEPLIGGGTRGRPLIVALASAEAGIEIRNLVTGELRCTIAHERRRVALSDDGRALVYSDAQGLGHVWDLELCRERGVVHLFDPANKEADDVEPFHFAPNGTLVVYNRKGRGRVTLLDPRGQATHFDEECPKPSWAGYAVLSPEGRTLLSSCDSSQYHRQPARLWDVARGRAIAELDLRNYTTMPVFSSDGKLLIFGTGAHELAVVRVDDGHEILRLPIRKIPISLPQMRVHADSPALDLLTLDGDLVSYPISRAQLVHAACRILGRSEIASEASQACARDDAQLTR
ncbi:MAG: hypothetical protein HC927_07785, partial [Deltaproteobacteria bacterium]|nr:hypothetical protein [Deltaproteobacteria bacterium]